ncbi:MAG: hypothetical protein WCK35_12310 [Chloroflexota bacterium]
MGKILSNEIVGQIKEIFAQMKEPVQVLYFGLKDECDFCPDTRQLLEEVSAIDSRIGLSVYDLSADAQVAKQFKVDRVPGIV